MASKTDWAAVIQGAMARLDEDYVSGRISWALYTDGQVRLTEQLCDAEAGQ